ncbi:MAG: hypothetical protein IJ839_07145 [Ruminobacter sp.]|nr:hypothetical protein [Ruminobacter sp.]
MDYVYIDKTEQLPAVSTAITNASQYIAFDTEFMRQTTYYPVLCLLQLCVDDKVYLIDVIALKSIESIIGAIVDSTLPVICHAGSEDMEIITHYARKYGLSRLYPQKFFDVQTAHAFVGGNLQVGLSTLVKEYLNITLEKTETRSDWEQRPLTEEQLAYAVEDVIYLKKLYDVFLTKLKEKPQLLDILTAEQEDAARHYTEVRNADTTYLKMKGTGKFNPKKLRILQALCNLRHNVCVFDNIPLSFFMKNTVIVKLVDKGIFNPSSLLSTGVPYQIVKKYGNSIIQTATKAANDKNFPILRTYDVVNQSPDLRDIKKSLENYIRRKTGHYGIAKDLLISKRLLEDFIYTVIYGNGCPAIIERGWRGEILGNLDHFRDEILETIQEGKVKP